MENQEEKQETPLAADPTQEPNVRPEASRSENWEARFKGLKKSYDELVAQSKSLSEENQNLLKRIEELRSQLETKDSEIQVKTSAISERESAISEHAKTIDDLNRSIERMRLIIKEYPNLVKFEGDGLLPTADDIDDLRVKLKAFNEVIENLATRGAENKALVSGVQVQSSDKARLSRDEIYQRLVNLAGAPNGSNERQEFDELMKVWTGLESENNKE